MRPIILAIAITASICVSPTFAQCGAGVNTGGQCIPPEVLYPNDADRPRLQPQHSDLVWVKTWGAFAQDVDAQAVGTSVGVIGKSKAKDAAIADCVKHGGKKCKVTWTYHNQCTAVAVGQNDHAVYSGAPEKEQAMQRALAAFAPSDKPKIVYSACSLPVRGR